jgi:acetolactate synthase-1/2/3 large subunit
MVDADAGEMDKFDGRGINVAHRICARLNDFLTAANRLFSNFKTSDWQNWKDKIQHWKNVLPDDRPPQPTPDKGYVDAYHFIDELSNHIPEGEPIFVDTGGNLTWTCNGLRVKRGQQIYSAWNNTPMGYALPAAIGAAFRDPSRPVTCIIGDGGLMLCLGELATVLHHRLPIRILLFNNHGHGIQKQTIETWLNARYEGVHPESGLAFPDFDKLSHAFGFRHIRIDNHQHTHELVEKAYHSREAVFINVEINPDQKLYPVLKFGDALENQLPAISSEFIESEMIVPMYRPDTQKQPLVGTAGV